MKIRHERPMSDLSFQVRAPLGLELATGETVTVENWSLQGFEFPGTSDILPREAVLSIPFQGVDIRFPVKLGAGQGTRFLTFEALTGRQRETLAVFYRSILSGRMASTEDVITSLDTPVDLVPMEETEDEKASAATAHAPRTLRAAISVMLYVVVAVLVFWTLGTGIYSRLATIEIKNARIEAPLVMHFATQGGYVDEVLVKPGDDVSAGDILVRLETTEGEAALAEVRGRINLLEDRLVKVERRAQGYDAQIAAIRQSLVDATYLAPEFNRAAAVAALEAFDGRYSADHKDLFEARAAVGREIDGISEELRRLRRERGRLRNAADALHVIAMEPGTVTETRVLDGQFVSRGAPVVEIEGRAARQARGWADQSMTTAFRPGMTVVVTANSGSRVERLRGRISALDAGIDPDLSPEFGMLFTISFPELSPSETRALLPHLMPVQLEAKRAWAVDLEQFRTEWFSSVTE